MLFSNCVPSVPDRRNLVKPQEEELPTSQSDARDQHIPGAIFGIFLG